MTVQKIFDILLLSISLFGVYDFSQNQGILMGFWSVMALPLLFSIFSTKKFSSILWKGLFIFGIFILLINNFKIFKSDISVSELLSSPAILVFLTFNIATILFIYRSYIGWKDGNIK